MDRRSFLRSFFGGATVAAVAPTYFFAPIGGWKSDVIHSPYFDDISAATLDELMGSMIYQNFYVQSPRTNFVGYNIKAPQYVNQVTTEGVSGLWGANG